MKKKHKKYGRKLVEREIDVKFNSFRTPPEQHMHNFLIHQHIHRRQRSLNIFNIQEKILERFKKKLFNTFHMSHIIGMVFLLFKNNFFLRKQFEIHLRLHGSPPNIFSRLYVDFSTRIKILSTALKD